MGIDRRDFLKVATAGAESFKQGPVLGEYIAGRVFGTETDQALNDSFRLTDAVFDEGEEDFDFED